MSDASIRADAATATGPSFVAALCGFVSSMVAASALVLLLAAL
ncbi:hypothetical protein [Methylobacterium sp. J-076]|nr:hypothetical protein [Methylobacterium sp. J-076]